MTVEGPVRKAAERDRIIIWWLLHDAYMRAKIVPERIKTEQRLRANAARKASELALIGRSDTLRGLVEITHAIADKTEPIIGRKDPARPPFSLSDAEAVQNWARLFFPEATRPGVLISRWRFSLVTWSRTPTLAETWRSALLP
jgi:hypothetical protein